MKRILITGAGGNASQNFIASLRMADEPFYLVGTDIAPYHLETADLDASFLVPHCDEPDYLLRLQDIIQAEDINLVHAQPDTEVAFLSEHRELVPAHTFLPSRSAIRKCHDKMICQALLDAADVPVPHAHRVLNLKELDLWFNDLMAFGAQVWVRAVKGAGSRAALPVRSARQARNWIRYWTEMKGLEAYDFMLAEYLPGKEFAFQSLWYQGRMVTSMARERCEYLFGNLMPSGQSSSPSIARTVHRNDVNEVATAAVRAIDPKPHGVYCIDLKENEKGMPCVTEINLGRFFTTSNFFSLAGSNMPYYYVKLALGEALPDLPVFNAVEEDLYWVRGVDRQPKLIRGEAFSARPFSAIQDAA